MPDLYRKLRRLKKATNHLPRKYRRAVDFCGRTIQGDYLRGNLSAGEASKALKAIKVHNINHAGSK